MNARTLLGGLVLVVLGLMAWELRWVLLVLFGAVVLARTRAAVMERRIRALQLARARREEALGA